MGGRVQLPTERFAHSFASPFDSLEDFSELPRHSVANDEKEWQLLLSGVAQARNGCVLAFSQFHRLSHIGSLPFYLHIEEPDALPWLPLTATVTMIPWRNTYLDATRFRVEKAVKARKQARYLRYLETRERQNDFIWADWEDGVDRNRRNLISLELPPHSFVRVERVLADGTVRRLPRPVLGRRASRNAPSPRLLVAAGSKVTPALVTRLAESDLVIVDLQRLRSPQILRLVRELLAERPAHFPTVLFASSPFDVWAAGFPEEFELPVVLVASPPRVPTVRIQSVRQDRLAREMQFQSALHDMTDPALGLDALTRHASLAWWAANQTLHVDSIPEVVRFERLLEQTCRIDPLAGKLFTACHHLIHTVATDESLRQERLQHVVRSVANANGIGDILVLVRGHKDAVAVRAALAEAFDIQAHDLGQLGVYVEAVSTSCLPQKPSVVVLAAYTGPSALDAVLASGTETLIAVLDPLECSHAWHHVSRMSQFATAVGAMETARTLEVLAKALGPWVTHIGAGTELRFLDLDWNFEFAQKIRSRSGGVASGEASVWLTDGRVLYVMPGTRFEVLGDYGGQSRVAVTSDLKPGDEIVLLHGDIQTQFTERRIALLDEGPLHSYSETRHEWLTLVREAARARRLKPVSVAQLLLKQGYAAKTATVRAWLADDPRQASAPNSLQGFLALAQVLGLTDLLSSEAINRYYESIHAWRVLHRRAGREVAKAIRLAYSGRLGAASLARIERDWGVGIRELIMAAEVGVVDEVILPEGTPHE